MKKISTLLLIFLSHFCFSQNLVPNPSFEQYDTCPYALSQINFAIGWSAYRETPDYFNSCAPYFAFPKACLSVPSNSWGFQFARTGNAYIGFANFGLEGYIREYAGVQLNQSLTIGQKYFASFYVSRAANTNNRDNIAINKLGIRLSTVAYSYSNPVPIDNYAQIYTDSIIADTLNWTKVSGSFIADSAYRYLSIGNFFDDDSTSYIAFDSVSIYAYYYADDIYLSTDSIEGVSAIHDNNYIKVSPNLARDWIAIEGRNISKLSLYDVLGKLCFSKEISFSSLERIDVSMYNRGIYFLMWKPPQKASLKKLFSNNFKNIIK